MVNGGRLEEVLCWHSSLQTPDRHFKRRWIDANRTFDPRLINLSLSSHGAAYRLAGSLRSINVQFTPPPHQSTSLRDEQAPPSSPAMRNSTTYIPVPAGAPALPPVPTQAPSTPDSPMPAYQRLETPMGRLTERSPSSSSAHEIPPSLHPRWHAAASPASAPVPEPADRSSAPLPPRLKNPHDRTVPSVAQGPFSVHSSSSSSAPGRVSFGPGDPLFTANAPAAYPNPYSHQQPLPDRTHHTDIAGTRSIPNRTTARPEDVSDPTPSQPIIDSRAPTASHGEPGHEFDDCPGCRAELEDAIQASLQTAKQEEESRRRAPLEQQELDRLYAITSEEEERRRRLAMDEEALLLQAIEDSRREAELQSQRHANDEDVLLEESRQHAMRQRDQDAIKESEMLEAAKMASEMHEQQRLQRIESLRDAERKALQISLQEQEEEWARRESAERSLLEFLEQRGHSQDTAAHSFRRPSVLAQHQHRQNPPLDHLQPSRQAISKRNIGDSPAMTKPTDSRSRCSKPLWKSIAFRHDRLRLDRAHAGLCHRLQRFAATARIRKHIRVTRTACTTSHQIRARAEHWVELKYSLFPIHRAPLCNKDRPLRAPSHPSRSSRSRRINFLRLPRSGTTPTTLFARLLDPAILRPIRQISLRHRTLYPSG